MEYNIIIDSIGFWSPHEGNNGGMRIYWSYSGGFGTTDFVLGLDNKLKVEKESMSDDFMKALLTAFYESAQKGTQLLDPYEEE